MVGPRADADGFPRTTVLVDVIECVRRIVGPSCSKQCSLNLQCVRKADDKITSAKLKKIVQLELFYVEN